MPVRVAPERGARLDQVCDVLLRLEPHLAYANFPPIARRDGAVAALHRRRWRAAADAGGVLVARDEDERPLGLLALQHREFESRHFNMAMAAIEPPAAVAEDPLRLAALRALYRAAARTLRARGYQHLAAVTSTHDRAACWALQELGGFHVGTKISWMQALTGRSLRHELPPPLRIEVYDKPAIPTLTPATWRRLHAWSATAFDRGPYVFDLSVPYDRAMHLYAVWTQKALSGEWADALLVVRDGDEVVAFHSMMWLHDLSEAAGVGILGRGIGGTLPGYRGLFTTLQRETAAVRPLGAGFLENETQASTVQSINVFGKLGHRCLRSTASFHLRLDGTGRGRRAVSKIPTGGDTDSPPGRFADK
jgi:L-amino acid N-acyltransferase YncA